MNEIRQPVSLLTPARRGSEDAMDYLMNLEPVLQWLAQLRHYSLNSGAENQIQLKQLFQEHPNAPELNELIQLIESINPSQTMTQKMVSEVHRMSKETLEKFIPELWHSPFPRRTYTPPFPGFFLPIEQQSSG